MAYMKVRSLLGRNKNKLPGEEFFIKGLPPINYYPPIVVTLLATLALFLVTVFLTLVAFGNSANAWNNSGAGTEGATPAGFLLCGSVGLFGVGLSFYFLLAIIKGVRDLGTPLHYTRGNLTDKRAVAGRMAGDWIGVTPEYAGTDINAASIVTDDQASASVDRSQIVHTRTTPGLRTPPPKRRGYLSPDRISTQVEVAPLSLGEPGPRVVFRIDKQAYEQLQAGEEMLVAHSRYLEHIYYISHLRDGRWESFKNKTLI
jgi:hypothetical protein